MTYILGLTGPIASGKSTVREMFEAHGVPVICADSIAHRLQQKDTLQYRQIIDYFGEDILDDCEDIDRNKLVSKVIDGNDLKSLEDILHPAIRAEFQQRIERLKAKNVPLIVLDVPLLYTSNLQAVCDAKLVCMCDETVRKERAFERPGMSEEKWNFILKNQPTNEEYYAWADIILNTQTDIEETKKAVEAIVEQHK